MRCFFKRIIFIFPIAISVLVWAEEEPLQFFMKKVNTRAFQLQSKEKSELLFQIENLLKRIEEVHQRLVDGIQGGEFELRYQEGKFWISQLERDREWMKVAREQLVQLKDRSNHLVAALELYRALKNLSTNFNAYNNQVFFSASIGDLAPEIALWTDPVFYQLFLLPLARSKEKGIEVSPKSGKSSPKTKGP